MRQFAALLLLSVVASSAFADVGGNPGFNSVPEPESLALLGIGALALLVTRRTKK